MNKAYNLFFLLILLSFSGFTKSFNFLSSKDAISVEMVATEEGYKNIHLLAVNKNQEFDSVPLKLQISIGKDTLVDYIVLGDAINTDIKTLYLYEQDSVSVELFVLSDDSITVKKIKGNLKFNDPMVLKSEASPTFKSLIGNYWDVKQPIIFRVNKFDSIAQVTRFTIAFGPNYAYDKFYYQVNVIAPDSSFYSVEGNINVNKKEFLSFEDLELDLTQEVGVSQNGKYILEVVPLMGGQRINGIKSVGYQSLSLLD